jgi:hypothetical protein
MIVNLLETQKSYEKKDQPEIALILDDVLGSIKKTAEVNMLARTYR